MPDMHFSHLVVGQIDGWESILNQRINHRLYLAGLVNFKGTVDVRKERFIAVESIVEFSNVPFISDQVS